MRQGKDHKKVDLTKLREDGDPAIWSRLEQKYRIQRRYEAQEHNEAPPTERSADWSERMRRMLVSSVLDDFRQHTFPDWHKKGVDIEKLEEAIKRLVRSFSPVPITVHRCIKPSIQRLGKCIGELKALVKEELGPLPPDEVRSVEEAAISLSDRVGIGLGESQKRPGAPPKDAMFKFADEVATILQPLKNRYRWIAGLLSDAIPGGYQGSAESLKRQLRAWRAEQRHAQGSETDETN